MVNVNAKATLAKLLAKEGISIKHGSYETAFFDVESRTLGLPLWKDMDKLYDLLVGHEVGHALFTPVEGWNKAEEAIPGIPRAFVNIVEDIRIEKLMQRKYPGLSISFKRGYTELYNRDFFKIGTFTHLKAFNYKLIDRLNIKAKLRNLVTCEFTTEELPLVEEAFAVETWDDVLEVCRKLVDYANQEPQKEMPSDMKPNMGNQQSENPSGGTGSQNQQRNNEEGNAQENQSTSGESQSQDLPMENGSQDSEAQGNGKDKQEGESTDEANGVTGKEAGTSGSSMPTSDTHTAYEEASKDLVERQADGRPVGIVHGLTDDQWKECVVSYQQVATARKELHSFFGAWVEQEQAAWEEYETQTKRFTQIMAKEFEMKKAAWRAKRAQTARSGSLDVNRLYSYKYNDDIFKRMTHMPDAKNHGLFLLVDWSGSMWNDLGSVIKQVMTLTAFAKKVNIPFEVYSFTTNRREDAYKVEDMIDHHEIQVVHMLSSQMKKHEYNDAFRHYHKMAWALNVKGGYGARECFTHYEELGGTPLNACLTYMPKMIKDFRARAGIQKVIFTTLTDGCSSRCSQHRDTSRAIVDGRVLNTKGNETEVLLENIKKYADNVVGYFLTRGARGWEFNSALPASTTYEKAHEYRKEFLKEKMLHFKDVKGYNDYFVLRSDKSSLDTNNADFEVSKVAKKGEITRAFKKFSKSKRTNRVLATKLAEAVA